VSVVGVADCGVAWSDGGVVSLRLAMNTPFIRHYWTAQHRRMSRTTGTGH
jgi:hypothetical protein